MTEDVDADGDVGGDDSSQFWRNWTVVLVFVCALVAVRWWRARRRAQLASPSLLLPNTEELRRLRENYFEDYQSIPPDSKPLVRPTSLSSLSSQSSSESSAPRQRPRRRWSGVDTVQDLLTWSGMDFSLASQARHIPALTGRSQALPRSIMLCHDMAGNYAEDALVDGWYSPSPPSPEQWAWGFRPTHFAWTETLVYFAHRLVCIPPAGWVHAAHKHGSRVLGTLMTEFERGELDCAELFATRESAWLAADRLNAIRLAHGFEGWLVNVENKLSVTDQVPHVFALLERLSELGCVVVWYDSVISPTGELRWQNALNDNNREFFLRANAGMLTNYGWDEPTALGSNQYAASRCGSDLVRNVWHGIDVFGRGTLGGGGWHCDQALLALERAGSQSACLFAPGWVLEEASHRDAQLGRRHQLEFWDKLLRKTGEWGYEVSARYPAPVLDLTTRGLYTDFCDGGGARLHSAGEQIFARPWLDLRRQTLQPRWDVMTPGELDDAKAQKRVTIRMCDSLPVFSGACAVQCVGRRPGKTAEDWCFFPVLSLDARLGGALGPASVLVIKAAVFLLHGDVALGLTLDGNTGSSWLTLTPPGDARGVAAASQVRAKGGWVVRTWELLTYEHRGKRVTEVGLSPLPVSANATASSWVDVRLGMVSLDETAVDCSRCVPTALTLHHKSGILTWKCACNGGARCSLLFCHVWRGSQLETCAFGNECAVQGKAISIRGVRWDGSQSPVIEL